MIATFDRRTQGRSPTQDPQSVRASAFGLRFCCPLTVRRFILPRFRSIFALALLAFAGSALAADPAKLSHAGLGKLLKEAGYNSEDNGLTYAVPVGNKEGWIVDVMLDFTKDDSCLLVIFNGGKLPKSFDQAMLVKMLQENDGTADPYFGLTKDGMITLNYAIDNRGLTADRVKQAITAVSDYAAKKAALWQTSKWPAAK